MEIREYKEQSERYGELFKELITLIIELNEEELEKVVNYIKGLKNGCI